MEKNRIIAIFALAVILRIAYVLCFPLHTAVGDAYQYDTIGWNIASGAGFSMIPGIPTPERAPGFPFFLSVLYFIFGHSLLIATLAQATLGALTCLLLYDAAKRLFDEGTAMAASLLACFYPVLVVYTGLLLSETLFTFLLVLCLDLFVRSENGEKRIWLILSGAALGLATLTRATTILFPAAIFIALFLSGAGRTLKKSALVFLAFVLVILPWTMRNYAQFKVFLPVATGGSTCLFATGRMAEGGTYAQGFEEIAVKWKDFEGTSEFTAGPEPHITFDRQLKVEGLKKIKGNLSAYCLVVLKRIPKYWLSSHSSVFGVDQPLAFYYEKGTYFPIMVRGALLLFHSTILIMTLFGMFYARHSFKKWAIFPIVFLYFNMHASFDLCPRYFVPIFPFMLMFCAVTLRHLCTATGTFNPEKRGTL